MNNSKDTRFDEVELIRGDYKVVWEWIGEGVSGDYNPDDPNDVPLLRFSCYKYDAVQEWLPLEDSSYCTDMPLSSSVRMLAYAAAIIMEAISTKASYKRELEYLSYFCPQDFDHIKP